MTDQLLQARRQNPLYVIFLQGIPRITGDFRIQQRCPMDAKPPRFDSPPLLRISRRKDDEFRRITIDNSPDFFLQMTAQRRIDFLIQKTAATGLLYLLYGRIHAVIGFLAGNDAALAVDGQAVAIGLYLCRIQDNIDRNPVLAKLDARIIGSRKIIGNDDKMMHVLSPLNADKLNLVFFK